MLVGKQELMEEACSHLAMDVDVEMNTVELVVLVMASAAKPGTSVKRAG